MFKKFLESKIKTKTIIAASVVIILNFIMICATYVSLMNLQSNYKQLLDDNSNIINYVKDWKTTLQTMNVYVLRFTVFRQDKNIEDFANENKKVTIYNEQLLKSINDEEIKKQAEQLKIYTETCFNYGNEYFAKLKRGDAQGAQATLVKLSQTKAETDLKMDQLIEMQNKYLNNMIESTNKQISFSVLKLLMISIIISALIIAVMVGVGRIFAMAISRIGGAVSNIDNGDLTVRSSVNNGESEINDLYKQLNNTSDYLENVIKNIKESSEEVLNASQKLAKATEESGATMEEVASSISSISKDMMDNLNFIQQATTNVGEVSSSADMVAKSCREVADESRKVRQDAMDGGNSVKQVLVAVNEVASSSKDVENVINELSVLSQKIGEIIEIITGISTQTNLLSLNAAIEAARAGEAGRGFAVVAEEIRKLAAESSEAAKDITNLVIDVQDKTQNAVEKITIGDQKVTEGVKKATDTDEYIQGIVKAIDKVTNEIDRISSAAVQQSEFAKRMNDSMNNILKITETTADSSQQMSAGVQEQTGTFQEIGFVAMKLSKMAEKLNDIVKQFKVR